MGPPSVRNGSYRFEQNQAVDRIRQMNSASRLFASQTKLVTSWIVTEQAESKAVFAGGRSMTFARVAARAR